MSKFKVGDRVKIIGDANFGKVLPDGVNEIGCVALITRHNPHDKDGEYLLSDSVWFPETSIELFIPEPKITLNGATYVLQGRTET